MFIFKKNRVLKTGIISAAVLAILVTVFLLVRDGNDKRTEQAYKEETTEKKARSGRQGGIDNPFRIHNIRQEKEQDLGWYGY
jgi:flagellar biosynthesis/type III secretory pathway M-ring protein FliF/YscJ